MSRNFNVSIIKPRRRRFVTCLIIVGVVIGICAVVAGINLINATSERGAIEKVLDEFMHTMANKDIEKALTFFSSRAKRQIDLSAEIPKLLEGKNYALFEGYRSLSLTSFSVRVGFDSNPDVPQGTVAEISGNVSYEENFTGNFDAILEKENSGWRLDSFHVTIPPDKVE